MKKLVISTLAVLIACPAFAAHPNDGNSTWQLWGMNTYIGVRGGISYNNLNYSFANDKESMTDTIFQGRAALGLELCKTLRSEIEWSIYSKAKDSENFGNAGTVKIDSKMQTLLWNMYWEFSEYQVVRPFIGAGAGVAFTDIDRRGGPLIDASSSKTKFSAMGTLGVTFDMEKFAVDVAARYNYVDVQSGLHNFGADIGVRFMF